MPELRVENIEKCFSRDVIDLYTSKTTFSERSSVDEGVETRARKI